MQKGIIIPTRLDNSELEKDYQETKAEIEKLEAELSASSDKKSGMENILQKIKEEAKQTAAAIDHLKEEKASLVADTSTGPTQANADRYFDAKERIKQINVELAAQQREQAAIGQQVKDYTDKLKGYNTEVTKTTRSLDAAKTKAGKLAKKLQEAANTKQVSALGSAFDKLGKRILGLVKRVFVLTVIASALRKIKEWLSKVAQASPETAAAMAKLKGALLTIVQPLVDVIIPALARFIQILAKVATFVASAVSAMFGKTAKESAASAKALYAQTEALEATGDAADDAAGALAGFDEINALSDDSGSGSGSITPDFNLDDTGFGDFGQMLAPLKQIAEDIKGIFNDVFGFIGDLFHGDFNGAFDRLGSLILNLRNLTVHVLEFLASFVGAFIDWIIQKFGLAGTPIGSMLTGIKLAFQGAIDFICGLLTGDFDRAVNGVCTILDGVRVFFGGVVDAVVGLWTGFIDKLDELTGGRFHLIFDNLKAYITNIGQAVKDIFGGLITYMQDHLRGVITFISGVFAGDWRKAWSGITQMFKANINMILSTFGAVVNFFVRGLNWLIDKINTISFTVPDWVPGIGGKSVGFSLPKAREWQVPKLAQGAVIPPNREFMAVLGDQRSGTNIEAPLETIKQAVADVMAGLGSYGGEENITVQVMLDGRKVAENTVKHINSMTIQAGKPVLVV